MNDVVFSHKSDEWSTPQELFDLLHSKFNFTLDACASDLNHLLPRYYTIIDSALDHSWDNEVIFCNPPYSSISNFISKALGSSNSLCVFLVPARTDTVWFHRCLDNDCPVYFFKGRLKFSNSKNSAPFPSCLIIIDTR